MFVNACGDMHVANFGVFASAERNLVFAINDFDEVHPGPWEWDLKRLAASAAVAARFMGGDKDKAADAARAISRSYRKRIRRFAEMGYLEVWYNRIDERAVIDTLSAKARKRAERIMAKAREKGHVQVLDKLTEQVDGEHRIIEEVPLIVRETHLENGTPVNEALDIMLRSYIESLPIDRRKLLSRYRIVDVGAQGRGRRQRRHRLLGDPAAGHRQRRSAVPPGQAGAGLGAGALCRRPAAVREPGPARGRRPAPDPGRARHFPRLGRGPRQHFYVRQLADMKGSIDVQRGRRRATGDFEEYCAMCGWALALAHAKSGDPAMIAGYCGNSDDLDEAIAKFALAYARQTDKDHEALDKARRSGRIRVASEAMVK